MPHPGPINFTDDDDVPAPPSHMAALDQLEEEPEPAPVEEPERGAVEGIGDRAGPLGGDGPGAAFQRQLSGH